MYPSYKDKFVVNCNETMEYGKLFQIATACEKKEK